MDTVGPCTHQSKHNQLLEVITPNIIHLDFKVIEEICSGSMVTGSREDLINNSIHNHQVARHQNIMLE